MVLYILYIKAELEGIRYANVSHEHLKYECLSPVTNSESSHLMLTYSSLALSPTANLCIDIRDPTSDEIREKVVIDPTQFVEQEEGSRQPDHHFSITWEGSKKASVLTVLSAKDLKTMQKKKKGKGESLVMRNMVADDNNTFVPVAAFETRGIEPYQFHCMGGEFVVESEGGVVFEGEDVDLSDDWADYDAENEISVSVMEFESKFEV